MIKKIEGNNFMIRTVNSATKWRLPNPPKYPQWFNKKCHYLDGLYSALVHYKPKHCLEIGTHKGDNSTLVFQKYFDNYMPEGRLITLDIVPCQGLDEKNITQVLVTPHHNRIYESCGASGRWFSKETKFESSGETSVVDHNCNKINGIMKDLGIPLFDFCFLDGDHERESFLGDLSTSLNLIGPEGRIMIDDTKEEYHACCHIFQEEVRPDYNVYDFDDWEEFVGCSIIWNK